MEKTTIQGVPKFLYVIIIALLAAMLSYALFLETPAPEKSVKDFYQAYFDKDYDTVAEQLSVFWAVQFLPQYQQLSPGQLIEQRDDIKKSIIEFISLIEQDSVYPEDLKIKVESDLTKQMENSAIVAYTFEENGQTVSMEVAVLIFENNAFRIYSMSPATRADLENISPEELEVLDANLKTLLQQE